MGIGSLRTGVAIVLTVNQPPHFYKARKIELRGGSTNFVFAILSFDYDRGAKVYQQSVLNACCRQIVHELDFVDAEQMFEFDDELAGFP
jgi:hypothetical protein